jgi:hypothetical protein
VVDRPDLGRVVGRSDPHDEVLVDGPDSQTTRTDRGEVRAPSDERHIGSRRGKPRAEIAADSTGSEHRHANGW